MNKKIAKLLALGMSIAMVFSLAACGDDTADEPSTEAPTTTEATTEAPAVPATGESESVSETGEQPTQAPGETQAAGITNPGSDVNAAVALYNDAVAKSGFTTANVQRTWGGSKVKIVGDLADLDPKVTQLFNEPATESVTPGAISAGDITSVSSNDDGSTITMTFKLKNTTLGENAACGDASYPYFITFNSGNTLVQNIAKAITNAVKIELKQEGTTIALSDGSITATVDKASGKMTALSCEVSEQIDSHAKVNVLPGSLTAMVKGSAKVSFS